MAKKVQAYIKLQVAAGKANPSPPPHNGIAMRTAPDAVVLRISAPGRPAPLSHPKPTALAQ